MYISNQCIKQYVTVRAERKGSAEAKVRMGKGVRGGKGSQPRHKSVKRWGIGGGASPPNRLGGLAEPWPKTDFGAFQASQKVSR